MYLIILSYNYYCRKIRIHDLKTRMIQKLKMVSNCLKKVTPETC